MQINHASQYCRLRFSKNNTELVVFEVLRQSDNNDDDDDDPLRGGAAHLAGGRDDELQDISSRWRFDPDGKSHAGLRPTFSRGLRIKVCLSKQLGQVNTLYSRTSTLGGAVPAADPRCSPQSSERERQVRGV